MIKTMRSVLWYLCALATATAISGALVSCGPSRISTGGAVAACQPGERLACSCPAVGGAPATSGFRTCDVRGVAGECSCAASPPGPVRCGDGRCDPGEDCSTCADDCGQCPRCNYAPSCSDAVGVPTMPALRADLCIGDHPAAAPGDGGASAPSGVRNCGPARLRLRVQKIHWHNGSDNSYCIVHASDGLTSSVAITPKSGSAGDGRDFFWDPAQGVFWGQKELALSTNNLTVTYDCFAVKSDAWAKVLKAAGDAADKAGGVAGIYGWAFGAGAVAADVAAAAVEAASGDEHRFNGQHTIDKADLLDLTNGRTWTVQRAGSGSFFYKWNWTLTVESWGCADSRPSPG